jgi:hypothetical protein
MDQYAGMQSTSGCSNGGNSYMCADFQPVPIEQNIAYGFAIQVGGSRTGDNPNCCKCYEVEWRSNAARGKKMIVQVVTPGFTAGSVKVNDLIILTPGGGVGPDSSGCAKQYGDSYRW